MPFGDKAHNEDVEALVDTLTMDGGTLNVGLSSTDIQQLEELSQELHLSSEMETEESEVIIETMDDTMEEEIVISSHEIEIETERVSTPEEILPDIKTTKTTVVPPLRPLTIAPKPSKVPIAVKPIPGQQLLVLQGAGGQTIKLLSSQGQELNINNLQLGRPVTIKPAMKQTSTVSLVQPKQVVMKKFVSSSNPKGNTSKASFSGKQGGHIMVVQKTTPTQSSPQTPTKTITFQQAQEMGLIATTKMLSQPQSTPKQHTVLLNKAGTKTIKLVPQGGGPQLIAAAPGSSTGKSVAVTQIKTPTKILPATTTAGQGGKGTQRFIFKNTAGLMPSAQIIQVAGSQALNTGQLHQINIPGKGMQYIKFVASAESAAPTTVAKVSSEQSSIVLSKPLKTIAAKTPVTVSGGQMVLLPTYVQSQLSTVNAKVPIPMQKPRPTPVVTQPSPPPPAPETTNLDSNGMRPRKPCNCTKSQCLKLYCDCFANGEFCYKCNCMNCFNNLQNEDHRQRAIRTCLERNPNAFRPKIGKAKDVSGDTSVRKHTKGCNCKRSGCLKNYCECYEAKIACSNNCKCVGCRNIEDSVEKKASRMAIEDLEQAAASPTRDSSQMKPRRTSAARQAISFVTDDVIDATAQCMLTILDSGEMTMESEESIKSQIITEFGRCLKEIIDYSSSNNN